MSLDLYMLGFGMSGASSFLITVNYIFKIKLVT